MWILVIDDEEDMCWALAKALSQEGKETVKKVLSR
jgi:DNA-binding NtrC family response regulator